MDRVAYKVGQEGGVDVKCGCGHGHGSGSLCFLFKVFIHVKISIANHYLLLPPDYSRGSESTTMQAHRKYTVCKVQTKLHKSIQ